MKKVLLSAVAALSLIAVAGCDTAATVASRNLSKAADEMQINRRIVFYNGITDKYMLTIEGRCAIDTSKNGNTFFVLCKTGPGEFKKHFLGLSDNVTFFAEQLDAAKVSEYHYKVVFKPQSIVPDVDFKGSAEAAKDLLK